MKKLIPIVFILAVVVTAFVLLVKLISGAVSLVTGLFQLILSLAVILALVVLVVWMFRFASKRR